LNAPEAATIRPREARPGAPVFAEPWHAEVLALAYALTRAGMFPAAEWAAALGAEIRLAGDAGRPDTEATYYAAALAALERLVAEKSPETGGSLADRVEAWRRAYLNTPHGRPVTLAAADHPVENGPDHHHHDRDH
jgi:nitrile hydratase accessory protein